MEAFALPEFHMPHPVQLRRHRHAESRVNTALDIGSERD
jgi:hypothetical protein